MKKMITVLLLVLITTGMIFSLEVRLSDSSGSLQTAITQIASDPVANGNGVIIVDQSVVTDVTGIPAGISLHFTKGNIITTGDNLAVNGPIEAGIYQIFNGKISGTPLVSHVVPQWWGAKADGLNDDTNALDAAFAFNTYLPEGTYYFDKLLVFSGKKLSGASHNAVLAPAGSGEIRICNNHDVLFEDFQYNGQTNPGFYITDNSSAITFRNIYFKNGNQRILLGTCNTITVDSCTFEETGYAIIQQLNLSSSHVLITDCIAKNITSDFVEANCGSTATSSDWIITKNRYVGNYSTGNGIETRFAGITGVEGVTINDNYIEKLKGESVIRLSAAKGNTIISGNQFYNCDVDSGYVYLISSDEDTIISNNFFVHDDDTLGTKKAINLNSGAYSNKLLINNNYFKGKGTNGNLLDIIDCSYNSNISISNNVFDNCARVIFSAGLSGNIQVSGNNFISCDVPIQILENGASSGGACNNWLVETNQFSGTQADYCIKVNVNANATAPSCEWVIIGNRFDKSIALYGSWAYAVENHTILDNVFNAGMQIVAVYSHNFLQAKNRRIGDAGWIQ